jgi:hypothetical protein
MPELIIAAVTAIAGLILPGVLIYLVFGPGSSSNAQKIEQFGQAIVQGPVNTAINGYIKVALIFVGLGGAVYIAETQYAKHEGQTLPAPPVAALGPPPPPTFGAAGGIGFQRGGVGISQGVGLGQAAPVLQPSGEGAGRPNAAETFAHAQEASSKRRTAKATERRTQQSHDLTMRERETALAAKQNAGAGFTERSGRSRYRRWR